MINPDSALRSLPSGLRTELLACFRSIVTNYIEGRWEPSELNGGKFCEVVFSIIEGALSGAFPSTSTKPSNIVAACRALESRPANSNLVGDRSFRILIPRLLPYLYEIRNNRGVGHVGGDVNPNRADAEATLTTSSWIMAELVRIFHGIEVVDAQEVVDALVIRRHPLIWKDGNLRRVLEPSMKKAEQVLALLYSEEGWTNPENLRVWVEYANSTQFKTKVLQPLHKKRLIEYDRDAASVKITPLGARHVEARVLKS